EPVRARQQGTDGEHARPRAARPHHQARRISGRRRGCGAFSGERGCRLHHRADRRGRRRHLHALTVACIDGLDRVAGAALRYPRALLRTGTGPGRVLPRTIIVREEFMSVVRAASRRRFLQFLASSPLFAAGTGSAIAETLLPKAKLPDPLTWAPLDAH